MKALIHQVFGIFSRQERFRLLGLVTLMLLGAWVEVLGIGLVIPFLGILNNPALIHENPVLRWLYTFLGIQSEVRFMIFSTCALVLVFIVKNGVLAILYFSQAGFVVSKEVSLSSDLLTRYLAAPYALHLDRNSADLIRTVTTDVSRVTTGFLQPMLILVTELLVLAMIAALLIYINPLIALLVGAMMSTIGLFLMRYFKAALSEYRHDSRRFGIQAQKWASQALGALKEVKVFRAESYFNSAYESNIHGYSKGVRVFTFLSQTPRLVVETLAVSSMLLLVVAILSQEGDVRNIVPLLAVFALAAIRIMPSVTRIIAAIISLRFCRPALDSVTRDLLLPQRASGDSQEAVVEMDATPETLDSAVGFEGVWYRHPGMEQWILKDVSFHIARGECLAVVGHSGAGKSTLADLLLGLLEPDFGKVIVAGVDTGDIGLNSRIHIGYVPQHPYVLDESVRRNVAFGVSDEQIDDARVWQALDMARFGDKVRSMENGLNTEVGERGVKLSGGERQRLSIARALYFDPPIVVFDEATSSLDQHTEREINDTISGLAGSKTLIVVTHRLAAAARCDRIVFLERGSIRAEGKFETLYESCPTFRSMVGAAQ
ncbi:MAG: ABC transporter ATP-binding protein [Burkholderiaceae bacterium]|nr:MAG: ABC transporter ATP-binding protein [Burkholderiaceae bacterium]